MSFLPDRGAQYAALRGCRRNGGVPGPGPQADLQGGDHPALRAGAGPSPVEDDGAGRSGVLHLQRAGSVKRQEGRGEDAGRPENAGGILMRWPWRREARPMVSRVQKPGDGQATSVQEAFQLHPSYQPALI